MGPPALRPFRFAALSEGSADPATLVAQARRAEEIGFDVLVLPDHVVTPLAPLPVLQAAAAATERLRVGTLVIDNDFRHPALLAKEVATLDNLIGGRFELGIGAGWHEPEYDAIGMTFEPAPTRIARLEEALHVVRGLWADGPFSFHGAHYRIVDLDGQPKPAQRPCPPVLIGGGGERVVRLAGRHADIVNLSPMLGGDGGFITESVTAAGIERRLGWLRDEAGGRFDQLEIGTYYLGRITVGRDRASAAEEAARDARDAGFDLSVDEVLESPMFLVGAVEDIIEDLIAHRERFGFSYHAIPQSLHEVLAPVVGALAGT